MGKASKKYRAAAEAIDATRAYRLEDAIGIVCAAESRNFDEGVDIPVHQIRRLRIARPVDREDAIGPPRSALLPLRVAPVDAQQGPDRVDGG